MARHPAQSDATTQRERWVLWKRSRTATQTARLNNCKNSLTHFEKAHATEHDHRTNAPDHTEKHSKKKPSINRTRITISNSSRMSLTSSLFLSTTNVTMRTEHVLAKTWAGRHAAIAKHTKHGEERSDGNPRQVVQTQKKNDPMKLRTPYNHSRPE